MINSRLYYPIYFAIISIVTFLINNGSLVKKKKSWFIWAYILCLFLVVFVGLRPYAYIFTDMSNYKEMWDSVTGSMFVPTFHTTNILFDNLFRLLASSGIDIYVFFVFMAAIYFGCMLFACKRLFPNCFFFAFIVYLAAFSTLSYGTNGIKAGAAASIFLLAIAYRDKIGLSLLFSLFSYGFHHSMEVPIILFYVAHFIRQPRYYFFLWGVCVLLALFHFTGAQELFATLGDEQGAYYMLAEEQYWVSSSFRWDFVLYSCVPIVIGWVMVKIYRVRDEGYYIILNTYTACNSFWLLCMYAEFTNRIAYLSWFLYPIVLIYPFLKVQYAPGQIGTAKIVSYIHLFFSLFMLFIYYGSLYR